ncbi:MAG: UbiA prenyltransferase family protein [Nanoarchaeota archaeon]
MLTALNVLRLLRVKQWYKNAVIFIPLIFSFNLFDAELFILTILGFIALCFVSSSGYILNDLVDVEKDKHHPEKKNRVLASGKVGKGSAVFISIILLAASLLLSFYLSPLFLCFVLGLFALSQTYNLLIRDLAFLDIALISVNFVLRTVSGGYVIDEPISYWVVLCTFFISFFLVSAKRSADVSIKHSKDYRPAYNKEDKKVLEFASVLSATCVFVFFSVYSILFKRPGLLLSLPVALYITFQFLRSLYFDSEKVRNPENFVFDKKILISILVWLILIVLGLYFFR